ncbi:MAG: hypothetical protein ACPLRW_06635 [Moorellales bacterium]
MCTVLQFRVIDPRMSDHEILSAARRFGFRVEFDRIWRTEGGDAVFRVDGYAADGETSCCCPLADDSEGLVRLQGLLEFLLARCSELYYAADEICLEEEPVREIEPTAVEDAWRPGTIAPWARIRMPESFARGLAHLARAMEGAGVKAQFDRCGSGVRCRVPGLGVDLSAGDEQELLKALLAEFTWLWAEYGTADDKSLSPDAAELRRVVLALVRAGVI